MGFPCQKKMYFYLNFLQHALTVVRSLALNNSSLEQIADFIDAIHNLPELLGDWEFFNENLFLEYLRFYDNKWKKTTSKFSLVDRYEKYKKIQLLTPNEVLFDSDDSEIQDRIELLIGNYLLKIAPTKDNKTAIFRDKSDGRLWELYDLKGGDLYVRPFGLRHISIDEAIAKYDISTKIVDILRNIEKKI